jgi:hypothetical protein
MTVSLFYDVKENDLGNDYILSLMAFFYVDG